MFYFSKDDIYPNCMLFAKPIHQPNDKQERKYSKRQEAIEKDIHRCSGVLQSWLETLRGENRRWNIADLVHASETYVILHYMIISAVDNNEVNCWTVQTIEW